MIISCRVRSETLRFIVPYMELIVRKDGYETLNFLKRKYKKGNIKISQLLFNKEKGP